MCDRLSSPCHDLYSGPRKAFSGGRHCSSGHVRRHLCRGVYPDRPKHPSSYEAKVTLARQRSYHDVYFDPRIEVFRQSVPLTDEALATDLALDGKRRKPNSVEAWLLRRRSQQVRMNLHWLVGPVIPTCTNQPTEVRRASLLPYPRL